MAGLKEQPSALPTDTAVEIISPSGKDMKSSASESVDDKTVDDTIDPENEIVGARLLLIHTAICLCTFLVGLDFNIIGTAVPVITTRFKSIEDVGWYGSAFFIALLVFERSFALVVCASQPLAGKSYTLFSAKWIYLLYLAVFEIGSLVCALAPSSRSLIVGRAIAGLGASGVFAGGFVVLTTIIPLHKRPIWQGTMSSTFAISSVVGPIIGGALTQHVSWRWCFYLNLPIGGFAAIVFVVFFSIKKPITAAGSMSMMQKISGLDFLGFILFAGSISMLLLALQLGGLNYAWSSSVIIGLFVGSGVTFCVFVPWQLYRGDQALIPPKLFANKNVWLICASAFCVNGPFQTIIYWLPIWFQGILAVSPTGSGVRFLPTVIADVFASFIGAGLVMHFGIWNPFLLFAEAMVCIGAGLLTTLYPTISDGHWIGYQIFGGIGYSLASNVAHLGMQASLPKELVPLGATNLLMVISTSCAIFLAIGQTVFEDRLMQNLAGFRPEILEGLLSSGATGFRSIARPAELTDVLLAYSDSITQIFFIPAIAPVLSFLLVCGCRWTSLKQNTGTKVVDKKPSSVGNKSTDEGEIA